MFGRLNLLRPSKHILALPTRGQRCPFSEQILGPTKQKFGVEVGNPVPEIDGGDVEAVAAVVVSFDLQGLSSFSFWLFFA